MKRILCIIVAIVMLATLAANACAEEAPEEVEECLFRGIPWGSDYETVMNALKDIGFRWAAPEIGDGNLFGYSYRYGAYIGKFGDKGYDVGMTVDGYGTLKVAGYPVKQIKLYFACLPNKDGKIDFKKENTFFYRAEYLFAIKGTSWEGEDLLNKLKDVYGYDCEVSEKDDCGEYYTFYDWYIGDETMLEMGFETDEETVHVFYASKRGDDILHQAYDIQDKDAREAFERESQKNGTEGL